VVDLSFWRAIAWDFPLREAGSYKLGFMSLRTRVVIAIALVLLLGSVAGVGVAGWQAKWALRAELAAALAGARQTVASAYEDLPRSDHPARDLRQLVATFDGNLHLEATLVDDRGDLIYASRVSPALLAPRWFRELLGDTLPDAHIPAPVPGQGTIILRLLFANDVGALWREFVDLVAVLAISWIVGSITVWLAVGRALKPLSSFSDAFIRIGAGDYAARVPEKGPVELVRLGHGVNVMARSLMVMRQQNRALEEQLRTLQDEERADLARDLHDEIGPHLFAVNVDAATARRMIGAGEIEPALDRLSAIQQGAAHMQGLVRDILGRLRPTELIDLGLAGAVDELVAFWRGRHPIIKFEVSLPPDETVATALRETIYRVIQEGLNNAVRHGRPTCIAVSVTPGDRHWVTVRVVDDGAPPDRPDGAGYGLIGMRERVEGAGGVLTIERGQNGGWTVEARFPSEDGEERSGS
jgi:two-component system sensor histidine kinase UhpB